MEVNILYKLKRENFQGNSGAVAGVIAKGAVVSLSVYGSMTRPSSLADMVNIAAGATLDEAGSYTFEILPQYVYFNGTADSIELVNYGIAETLGAF